MLMSAAMALVLLCAGCSTSSLFVSYPGQVTPLLQDLRSGRPVAVEARFGGKADSADRVLYLAERGRIQQIQGNPRASLADYRQAIAAVEAQENEADVTARGAVGQLGAVLANDNALPYRSAGYERVMLHHLQALNYLMAGDVEGAAVEVRRAGMEQRLALDRHGKEIAKAKADAGSRRLDVGNADQQVAKAYAGLDEVAGKVKDSFQNAATFYISGVIYELAGQANDAYIDYKKALEIMPPNGYLQQDVLRLGRRLGMTEDVDQLKARYPGADLPAVPAGAGSLVLVVDDEFVPQKQQIKIPVPIISNGRYCGLVALAFPFYETAWREPVPFAVDINGTRRGSTQVVCSTRALAVKALKERLPALLIRQAIRASAKGVVAKELTDNYGPAAAIATSLLNYVTEQADLRSWYSLPDNVQIARYALAAGNAQVTLSQGSAGATAALNVRVVDRGVTVVYAKRAGGAMYVQQAAFGPGGTLLAAGG